MCKCALFACIGCVYEKCSLCEIGSVVRALTVSLFVPLNNFLFSKLYICVIN